MLSTDEIVVQSAQSIKTLAGKEIVLESQGKRTIIYFFAPWCQICHASIGNLQNIYEKNENLDVIAVALDYSNVSEVEKFVAEHKLTFPIALGNEEVKQYFQVTGYPSYYILNKENTIIGRSMGYSSELGLYLRSL